MDDIKEIVGMVAEKQKAAETGEEEDEEPFIFTEEMSINEKYNAVVAALPFNTNGLMVKVLQDKDGPRCLTWALQLLLNQAVAQEGVSYDTSTNKSALASKVLHVLFSIPYVKRYKLWDPRENYTQAEGTAMDEAIYKWLEDAMESITLEFYDNFGMPTRFKWSEFFTKLRAVWRWTRSNNSEGRKVRRAKKPKKAN